jgi:uncharacterized protein GlcG (DUF336 family)
MLTLHQADVLVSAAMAKAVDLGIAISVAVVDPAGHVRLIARMDGAGWFSPEIALGKAVAAAAFRADTNELNSRFDGKEVFATSLTPLSGGRLIVAEGGCVVRDEHGVLGAVGVSGATSSHDVACARAGIESLGLVNPEKT